MRVKKSKVWLLLLLLAAVWLARARYPEVRDQAWQLTQRFLDRQGSLEQLVQTLGRDFADEGLVETLGRSLRRPEGAQ